MTGFHKLWIDDTKEIPNNFDETIWCSARSAYEALLKIDLLFFDEVSLDNDITTFIGTKIITSWDILVWLVKRKRDGKPVPIKVNIHSSNCVASPKMIKLAKEYFENDN